MQARNSLLPIFISSQSQYCIPIFQRSYSWTNDKATKLLDDIISVAEDDSRPCHFIGSIIYLPINQYSSGVRPYHVIDGQQRLTTISLLLLALSEYSRQYYSESVYNCCATRFEQISELYLVNKFSSNNEEYYKLKLQSNDHVVYKKLLSYVKECNEKKETGVTDFSITEKQNPVFSNYSAILSKLKSSKVDPSLVIKGFNKLLLVDIPLDREDNAQLVFETVNSTGQKLNESEKITNYILMTVPPEEQDILYSDIWKPMTDSLHTNELDKFIKYYLTIQSEKKVGWQYYEHFKEFSQHDSRSTASIVREMKQYCDHYQVWKSSFDSSNNKLEIIIAHIKQTNQDLVIPVILKILEDLRVGRATYEEARSVLQLIESFWMRRLICDLPSNSVSSICILMLKNLGKTPYVRSFSKALLGVTYAQRMPTDEEIKGKLHEVPIYEKPFARMLLDRMEAHENKDYTHSSNHSIEHIMPQNIQSHEELFARSNMSDEMKEKTDWASDLGADWQQIQKKYLHTLGNLTLTAKEHNIKYKNYRFIEKKTMPDGYAASPIRLTYETLRNLDTWGEKEILARSDKLAEIICDIWKYPAVEQ